jgi:hypothetical protein
MAEAGRKEESFERGRELVVRGRTMMGISVPRDSIMRLSSTVGAGEVVSMTIEGRGTTYLMVIEIQGQYTVVWMQMRRDWLQWQKVGVTDPKHRIQCRMVLE